MKHHIGQDADLRRVELYKGIALARSLLIIILGHVEALSSCMPIKQLPCLSHDYLASWNCDMPASVKQDRDRHTRGRGHTPPRMLTPTWLMTFLTTPASLSYFSCATFGRLSSTAIAKQMIRKDTHQHG